MTLAPKIGLAAGGLALAVFAGLLWAKYGAMVYFDTLAAGLIGCFI